MVEPAPFVVGAPRSGTTLLRLMLDAHPALAIPPETGFVPRVARLRGNGDRLRRRVLQAISHHPKDAPAWRDFGLEVDDLRRIFASIEPFDRSAALRAFYRAYAARFGKPRWGDKTPFYGQEMDVIRSVLPEVRFVHIIRDGRAVIASLRDQWFAPATSIEGNADYWRRMVTSTRAAGCERADYLEVRYEELVEDPETVLRRVCAFIALDFDGCMLSYHERSEDRLAEHGERVRRDGTVLVSRAQRRRQQALTTEPPDPGRIGAWRSELTRDEAATVEAVAGDLLTTLEYASTR